MCSSPEVRPFVATPLLQHDSNASPSSSLFQPSDPQDAEVAKHYLSDKASFEATAKYWTEVRFDFPPSPRLLTKLNFPLASDLCERSGK